MGQVASVAVTIRDRKAAHLVSGSLPAHLVVTHKDCRRHTDLDVRICSEGGVFPGSTDR
jgi:hypothetical protein